MGSRNPVSSDPPGVQIRSAQPVHEVQNEHHLPLGIILLSVFFALGALIACVTALALAFPGEGLDSLWRLNPHAHASFLAMGQWAIALMCAVAAACATSAVGLWIRASWGHRLALVLLAVNLVADTANAFVRGDLRTLIGIPIAGALIAYLLSRRVRRRFKRTDLI